MPCRRTTLRLAVVGASGLCALWLGSECLHRRASCGAPKLTGRSSKGAEVILVLGYAAKNSERLHPLQQWRTDIAVRSMPVGERSRLVFSGAAKKAGRSEAEVMAAYARDALGVAADQIVLEKRAESTWQNVEYSLPELERASTIKVASDPMHAARARAYLRALRPDLVDRLAAADDYRFGERPWLKMATAGYDVQLRARARVTLRRRGPNHAARRAPDAAPR